MLTTRMNGTKKLSILMLLIVSIISGCTAYAPPVIERQIDLTLIPHGAFGMAEQDVYVKQETNVNQVVRIMPDQIEALADTPVFTAAEFIPHDPFGLSEQPIGPFPMGVELGVTLGEWVAATGTGTYTVLGGAGQIDLTFANLMTDGTYTLWCSYVSLPPHVHIVDLPCGAVDGSNNVFMTDENGDAQFHLTLDKLPDSTPEVMIALAVAYHSDGETHGMSPGLFGENSHVQIFTMIAPPEVEAWRTQEREVLAFQN